MDDLEEEIVKELGHVGCSGATCVRSASVNESRGQLWMFWSRILEEMRIISRERGQKCTEE